MSNNDPEKKLNMSLDAIIRTKSGGEGRPREGNPANRQPRQQGQSQQPRGRGQGRGPGQQWRPQQQQQMGRGQDQLRGQEGPWRPQGGFPGQGFPPGGPRPTMPNFGFPFGEGPFAGFPNPMMQQYMMQGMGFPGQEMPPMGMGMGRVPDFGNNNGPHLGGSRIRPPQAQQDQQRPAEAAVPLARLDDESGEVTVSLKHQKIVNVARDGTITLDSGGHRGAIMFQAFNAVLNTVGVSLTRPAKNDEWSVSDGRRLSRFQDGMTIPGKGPQALQRGHKIVAAFGGGDPAAAAAATAASNAAAAAAGIVLGKKPEESPQKRGQSNQQSRRPSSANGQQPQRRWSRGDSGGQNGAGSSEPGEIAPQDVDKIRRQKAQGRYRPY